MNIGKYVNGRLAINKNLQLFRGGDLLFEKYTYPLHDGNRTYIITFWQETQGILRYSYTVRGNNRDEIQNIRASLILIGGAVLIGGILGTGITIAGGATGAIPWIPSIAGGATGAIPWIPSIAELISRAA